MYMSFESFDPDDTGVANGNYFGFPQPLQESELVLLSAPWDATVSYNDGTAGGPDAILEASVQVEILDMINPDGWKKGIATAPTDPWIEMANTATREKARVVIDHIEQGGSKAEPHIATLLKEVNQASSHLNEVIYNQAMQYISKGQRVGLVGGDHSTPLGLIKAVARHHDGIGILHIDAHADLRDAYEGFEYSHASIMFNALKLKGVDRLVQVGIRDFGLAELELAATDTRVVQFSDFDLKSELFEGRSWSSLCDDIVRALPQQVYVSFDIDGLSPDNCPSTGTPVPGGLSYSQAVYLLCKVVGSGRSVVGFDVTEVSPSALNPSDQWDANVGARVLYKLCNLTLL